MSLHGNGRFESSRGLSRPHVTAFTQICTKAVTKTCAPTHSNPWIVSGVANFNGVRYTRILSVTPREVHIPSDYGPDEPCLSITVADDGDYGVWVGDRFQAFTAAQSGARNPEITLAIALLYLVASERRMDAASLAKTLVSVLDT